MPNLNKLFVIVDFDNRDDATNEPLFWSNQDGWVSLTTDCLSVFTKKKVNLPIGESVSIIPLNDAINLVNAYYEVAGGADPDVAAETEDALRASLDECDEECGA